jgi:CubicO group peptidase (beta-lactamase class C family)
VTRACRAMCTALGLGATLAAPAHAQRAAEHPRVQQATELLRVWLHAQRDYDRIPGLSAAVVHGQETVWMGAFGVQDLTTGVPASAGTIYSICSISKLFTAVGVMQLRDQGKLRLDDPVRRHLPWFAIRQTHADRGDVTVQGLLTHAAGLPRESDHPYWTAPDYPFPAREQIIERLRNQETLYPADTYYQYSNLGLTLAGEVVAAVSGLSYGDYVRRNILGPLGLASTTPEMPAAERGKRLAQGYGSLTRAGTREPIAFFEARGIAPAAGYASTAEDLAAFARWQFRLLEQGGTEVLNANTLREMHRVHWVDPEFEVTRGLGFGVWRDNNRTFVGHGGSCPGYRTQLLLRPAERIATIFLANGMVNASAYAQRMYDIMAPALLAAARDTTRPRAADTTLAPYTGRYGQQPWGAEAAMVAWQEGLAVINLPTMNPLTGMTRLRKTGDHTFRRIRPDDTLGETIVFEMGPDGRAARYIWHNNIYPRVPDDG